MSDWRAAVGNVFLFFLICGLSATVDFSHFKSQIKNKKAIATGLLLQFVVLPLLGFIVIKVLNLERIYGITLIIITSSPGGAYSNWFCSMFNGDLALSVTMTAISTIISIGMLPLNVLIYSQLSYGGDILSTLDWNGLGISLAVVITAISTGILSSYKFGEVGKFRIIANQFGNAAGLGLILFSFLAPEGGRVTLSGRPWLFFIFTPAPIVLGLISSVIISSLTQLKKPERVTVSVECCYQNTGIAITSCLTIFSGEEQSNALGVPFFYTGMQTLIVGLFCLFCWKAGWTKAPPNANFFKMLFNNYQDVKVSDENGTNVENGGDNLDDSDVEDAETPQKKDKNKSIELTSAQFTG